LKITGVLVAIVLDAIARLGMRWLGLSRTPAVIIAGVLSLAAVAGGLTGLAWAVDASLPVAVALVAAYPLVLAATGFYLPAERARLRRLLPSRA
jgi:hypothetical protein